MGAKCNSPCTMSFLRATIGFPHPLRSLRERFIPLMLESTLKVLLNIKMPHSKNHNLHYSPARFYLDQIISPISNESVPEDGIVDFRSDCSPRQGTLRINGTHPTMSAVKALVRMSRKEVTLNFFGNCIRILITCAIAQSTRWLRFAISQAD